MALLQSEYMQNFIDPPIEQTGGGWHSAPNLHPLQVIDIIIIHSENRNK